MRNIKNILIFFTILLSLLILAMAFNLYGDYKNLDYQEKIYQK